MKTCIKKSFVVPVLVAALSSVLIGQVTAQTFTILHSFTALVSGTNSDGAFPLAGLVISNGTLYGTASGGGSSGSGTVYALKTDGTGFKTLHSFTDIDPAYASNSDGRLPLASLILSGNTLYGTACTGGSAGYGTLYAVKTDGTVFETLHNFAGGAACFPYADLVLSGNTLYGTDEGGDNGLVYAVNTDGTGFTGLYDFTAFVSGTNSDGAFPLAGLVLSSNTLYGTARAGGSGGAGTVFAMNTNRTDFTTLYSFTALSLFTFGTNGDGANPEAGLVLSGDRLYGAAAYGGSSSNGTVFVLNTDGTGFTNLHIFTALGTDSSGVLTNSDGANPKAGLLLWGNRLYGTAAYGGSSGNGTVFALNTDGTGFTTLHSFTATSTNFSGAATNSDGAFPKAGLILSGNTLYGTASEGGPSAKGTVFSLSFRPQLTITPDGANMILSWPTNYAGFDYMGYVLQSTTNLASAVWTTNLPAPVIVNGQNTVTNPISCEQQFFRLSQ